MSGYFYRHAENTVDCETIDRNYSNLKMELKGVQAGCEAQLNLLRASLSQSQVEVKTANERLRAHERLEVELMTQRDSWKALAEKMAEAIKKQLSPCPACDLEQSGQDCNCIARLNDVFFKEVLQSFSKARGEKW